MPHERKSGTHDLLRRLLHVAGLAVVGAIAVTWAWNTVMPNVSGLARFRYAEGLSIALLTVFVGALFESGRRLLGGSRERKDLP
jgi:hypothetical protein